ncbi:MAG: hypothetical protein NTW11_01920 [Candidatus Staskawiczbacteria bacterium]|nr:hypothetical protein [Candidatus Staskawiczbacteria bacterium]
MAKDKLIKNITIDELAAMMNTSFGAQTKLIVDGFNKVDEKLEKLATREQVTGLDKRLQKVEKELSEVKTVLTDAHVL